MIIENPLKTVFQAAIHKQKIYTQCWFIIKELGLYDALIGMGQAQSLL